MAKILLVDDQDEFREGLVDAARTEGRELFEAENAEQAIELIKQHDFDLVVTDMKMANNKTAGFDVLKAAKENDIYTQVIVVTSFGNPDINAKAMRMGAYDYFERNAPELIDPMKELRARITAALEYRQSKLKQEDQP